MLCTPTNLPLGGYSIIQYHKILTQYQAQFNQPVSTFHQPARGISSVEFKKFGQ